MRGISGFRQQPSIEAAAIPRMGAAFVISSGLVPAGIAPARETTSRSSGTLLARSSSTTTFPNLKIRVAEHYYSGVVRWRSGKGSRTWLRIGSALIVCGIALTVVGCDTSLPPRNGKPVVLTTFTVLADIARAVAGPHLDVHSLIKPGAEIHGYEPTPGDLTKATEADLVMRNGMNLEAWFEQFIDHIDVENVTVSDGVDPIPIAGGDAERTPNPHAWMSPLNVGIYVENMVDAFAELDPGHAAEFRANGKNYKARLQQVHNELMVDLHALPQHQRALVTCEGAFSYLARDTGLSEHYIWPVNSEQQATPQRITDVVESVREDAIPAVFCESTVSDAPMQRVAETTGAAFGGVLFVDSLSRADGPVPTYLDLIRHDADTIATALTGGKP